MKVTVLPPFTKEQSLRYFSPFRHQKKRSKKDRRSKKRPGKYQEYILSDYWKSQRNYNIEFFGGRCALCGRKAETAHHRSYRYKGERENEDLTALCWDCHKLFHDNYEYSRQTQCFHPTG